MSLLFLTGATDFKPTDLPNLGAWYDGDDRSTFTLSGTDVAVWQDKSGNARHLGEGTNRPVYTPNSQNGKAGVAFTGTNSDRLVTSSYVMPATITQFVVYTGRTGTNGTLISSTFVTAGSQIQRDTAAWFDQSASSIAFTGGATLNNSKLFTTTYNYTSDNYAVFLNAVARGTSTTLGAAAGGNLGLGGRALTSEFLTGTICEVIVYERILTTADLLTVHRYLNTKWGLGLSL